MQYQAAVAEAQRLDQVIEEAESTAEGAKWARTDLALEQVRAGVSRGQWARDTGKHLSTIGRWVEMAERWPLGLGRRPPFSEAYDTIRGRAELGQYQTQARQAVRNMPPEQKAEVVREALEDLPVEQAAVVTRHALRQPEVADRVLRDPDARRTVRDADDRYHVDHQREAKERYELAEPRSVQIGAMTDLEYALTKARTAFEDAREAAEKLTAYNWPDNNKGRAEVLHQRAMAAGELVGQTLRGQDLDKELRALVEGSA